MWTMQALYGHRLRPKTLKCQILCRDVLAAVIIYMYKDLPCGD